MSFKGAVGGEIFDSCLHRIFHTFPLVFVGPLPVFQSFFKDLDLIFPKVGFHCGFWFLWFRWVKRIFLHRLDIWILSWGSAGTTTAGHGVWWVDLDLDGDVVELVSDTLSNIPKEIFLPCHLVFISSMRAPFGKVLEHSIVMLARSRSSYVVWLLSCYLWNPTSDLLNYIHLYMGCVYLCLISNSTLCNEDPSADSQILVQSPSVLLQRGTQDGVQRLCVRISSLDTTNGKV